MLAKRLPAAAIGRFAICTFFGLLIISIFANTVSQNAIPNKSEVQNTIGAMYLIIMMLFMVNTFSNLLIFQIERDVFFREHANQMYSVMPYYMTKLMIELPVLILTPLVMMLITYWAIGLRATAQSFFMQYLALEMVV